MKKIALLVFLNIIFLVSGCSKTESLTGDMAYIMEWNGTICEGTYTGSLTEGKPQGKGNFHGYITYDSGMQDEVSYEGEWLEGKPDGTGIFTNITQTISYEGTYSENKKTGTFIVKNATEDIYEVVNYKKDTPYGVSVVYNETDDKPLRYERYYKGQKVSEIVEKAAIIPYEELIYNTDEYLYDAVCIEGEIIGQIMQYKAGGTILSRESGTFMEFTIADADGNEYMVYYNTDYQDVAECYVGELEIGEQVSFYGYVKGLVEWNNVLPNYPTIQAICAKTDKEPIAGELMPVYDNFIRYPYEFTGIPVELTGTVTDLGSYDDNKIYLLIKSEDYTEGKTKKYFCYYTKKNQEKYGVLPLIGDTVSLTGELKQVYFKSTPEGIVTWPKLNILSIEETEEDMTESETDEEGTEETTETETTIGATE